MVGESEGLKNGQTKRVVRLLCLPPEVGTRDAHQEDSIGNLVGGAAIGGMQTGVSCGTCFLAEIAVELTEQGITVFLCPVR